MRALHTGIDLRAGGHIDSTGDCAPSRGQDVVGRALRTRLVDIPDRDGSTLTRQTLGGCETQARGPACHDRILAG